jgi:hypothetical protein
MKFLLISDTVKRLKEKCNQTEKEGSFQESLNGRLSHRATLVQRGAYLRENVST